MEILGIDIGGSYIKSGLVDVVHGSMSAEPLQIPTPRPATPEALAQALEEILSYFNRPKVLGIGFPGVVQSNTVYTAPNLDEGWEGLNLSQFLKERFGVSATALNDADAAGLAEMTWGAGKGYTGTTLVLTLGTGIGSAFFHQGRLCPNFELGHLILPEGKEAEQLASAKVRVEEGLSWEDWAQRLDQYLIYLHQLFWPERFILGGGIVAQAEHFIPHLSLKHKVDTAQFLNSAGFMGSALGAYWAKAQI